MQVSELFQKLSYGELSNLAVGMDGAGSIAVASQPKIITYTNEALLRLFSRFVLRENDLTIQTRDWITNYKFLRANAFSNPSPAVGAEIYILDTLSEPYEEDLIRVLALYNSEGRELPLNDIGNPRSMFTPQPNVLQVPSPTAGGIVAVIYQARHPELPTNTLESVIELPVVLEPALRAYIAYQVYSSMNGQEHSAKAAEYMNKYDAVCREVLDRDLVSSSSSTTTHKFQDRGFV